MSTGRGGEERTARSHPSWAATARLGHDYERRTGEDKQRLLWQLVLASRYPVLPAPRRVSGLLPALRIAKGLLLGGRDTFRLPVDALEPRTKLSHPLGVVATAEFRARSGAAAGAGAGGVLDGCPVLVRLSISGHPEEGGFSPSMAVKFLIDGHPSVNLHVTASADGQEGPQEFLRDPLTNILPEPLSPAAKLSRPLLARVIGLPDPFRTDIDHLTFRDRSGAIDYSGRAAPHQILFRPSLSPRPPWRADFREELMTVATGSELYTAQVSYAPGGGFTPIGSLVTTSGFAASAFGDRSLHFQHRRRGVR
ncbi:hypothetical protein ABZX40_30405 [Streptomyces sp. NPDC004610]|uniref:hypothetical protein n=1 Tax=unclassified Streptomyces TaxID=2593676 RepID=UPI0033A14343